MTNEESRPAVTTEPATQPVSDEAAASAQLAVSDIHAYLDACLGDTEGIAHVAIGHEPHLVGGKHSHGNWTEHRFAWPTEADRAVRQIRVMATGADVYVCPYVMRGDKRSKGDAVTHTLAHADIDEGMIDVEKVRTLCGFAVSSGSHGHGHVYVALIEPVTVAQHEALCRGLGRYLGAVDAKISDNDVLRPPGTLNHKVGAGPVLWLVHPSEAVRRTPDDLARQLGVKLPSAEVNETRRHTGLVASAAMVDLAEHPAVQAALDTVSGDRSGDTYRVVATCFDDNLTLDETRSVVASRADLAERLDGRNDDDVLTCWLKVIDAQQEQVQITGAPGDSGVDGGDAIAGQSDAGDVTHSGHLGMAVKMSKHFKDTLIYVNNIGWHCWDGKRYAPDGNGAARRAVHSVIERDRRIVNSLHLPAKEEQVRLQQIARYETAPAITGILTEAAALEVFSVTVYDLDADPYLVNCANGTLDLRTMELGAHDPADRMTKVANAAYRPEAGDRTEWTRFLQTVLPDKDVRDYIQRNTGLSLLGEVNGDKQIAPIMTGSGANGKTTFIEALSFSLGDYAATAEPTLLMAKRGDTHPTGVADLRGRRFVSVVETEQGRRFDIALLKWLTGGDTLKARYMRQNFFSFSPSHLLVMATNHLPRIDDDTEAVWRRIRVIPFTVQIPKAHRDKHLRDKLRADADAVLTWIIDGWKDYRRRGGLDEPDAVLVATNDYQADSDAIGRFIDDECLTGGAQSAATTQALYDRWERWAAKDGCLSLSRIAFGRALDAKGYPADKNTHDRLRRRICLKSEKAQADE